MAERCLSKAEERVRFHPPAPISYRSPILSSVPSGTTADGARPGDFIFVNYFGAQFLGSAGMSDLRSGVRTRVFKAGYILFNRAGSISCTVRNISGTGARLDVASVLDIPDTFRLQIPKDDLTRSCRVVRRTPHSLGVRFE
jgi:hypothetical protein